MNENMNVQDFEIEEQVEQNVDPLEELVNMDFTDENFDVGKYHTEIQKLKVMKDDPTLKLLEAENIIKDLGPKYLNNEYNERLNKTAQSLTNYLRKFSADGKEMKEIESGDDPIQVDAAKDKVYELANFLFNNFINLINNLMFSMELTSGEHKFLDTTLRQKLEYDSNEVLNIITLIPKLDEWKETSKIVSKTADSFMIELDIKFVVMIYHFISKHKVKGFGNELLNFNNMLMKIGETNKIFNAYNIIKDRIGDDFKAWATSITVETPPLQTKPTLEQPVGGTETPTPNPGMVYENGEWVQK